MPIPLYLGSVPYLREADVVLALNVAESSVVQDAACRGDGEGVSENEGYTPRKLRVERGKSDCP